jgi:hypothetical protein
MFIGYSFSFSCEVCANLPILKKPGLGCKSPLHILDLLFFFLEVLGIKLRAFCMLGRHYTTELSPVLDPHSLSDTCIGIFIFSKSSGLPFHFLVSLNNDVYIFGKLDSLLFGAFSVLRH